MGSSSAMRKMNWSQWTQLSISRCRSSVMVGSSAKPSTSSKKRQMSSRLSGPSRSAGSDMATWLNRGWPDG